MDRSQFKFFHPYRVRYSDIDSQRVVYFAQFFVIANAAIHEYFEWLEFPYLVGGWENADTDFHFAHTGADYRRPVRYDDRLQLGVRTARLGSSSITLSVGFFQEGPGEEQDQAAVEITMVLVNFNQATHKPQPLPDDFAASIKNKEGVTRAQ
jgi:acyl-CoA thioester hydrolase